MAVLALDLGTTGVRAVAYGDDGAILGSDYRRLHTAWPAPGRLEQDAGDFRDASLAVLRGALAAARLDAAGVRALGLTAQRGSAIAWDARDGRPLAPVIGWQDTRTAGRVAELAAAGLPASTMAAGTKFEWLLTQDAVRAAADAGALRLGTPDVWLGWALADGAFVTDVGNGATTLLLEPDADGPWSASLLAMLGLQADWLPALVPTDAVVGELPARLLGAPIPLAARVGDQQAACWAQGVRSAGRIKASLGTAAILDAATGAEPAEAPDGCYALPLWQRSDGSPAWGLEATVMTAGAAVDWLVRCGLLASPEDLDAAAAAGAPGVEFVPALMGLGSPWAAEAARGRFDGLGLETDAAAMVRAVVEGIAHRIADATEALAPAEGLRIDGGLARSDELAARIADFTGRAVDRAAETETTARGAAALAAASPDVPGDALPDPAPARRFEPALGDAERAARRDRWRETVAAVIARAAR